MSSLVKLFRVVGAATLALGVWGATVVDKAPVARAAGFETLMVPSAAMGRDIPVAFQGGGPMRSCCWTPSTPVRTSATG